MKALNIDPINPDARPAIAELQRLGIGAVRYYLKGPNPDAELDAPKIELYTPYLDQLAATGIKSLIVLAEPFLPGTPHDPQPTEAWVAYIARFAARAGQLARLLAPYKPDLQIWNEPDLPACALSEAVYAQMLAQTREAVKAAAPALRVVTAGLGSGDPGWLENVIRLDGGHLPADVVALHPYRHRPERNWPAPTWGAGYIGDLLAAYRRVTDLPLIFSELGEESLSAEGQAEYLRRFYRRISGYYAGEVESIFWFCYTDAMTAPFGLLEQSGRPKPTWRALGTLRLNGGSATAATVSPQAASSDKPMVLTAIVNKADYENICRNYWAKEDIDADFEVDGVLYTKGEISFRGTSSLNYPKKGFKVKFNKKQLYQGKVKRFDLSASYSDKSLIRERMSFELFHKTNVVSSTAWPIDFTIQDKNGEVLERGLFAGLEHVDEYFFQNRGREIGTLYKADGGTVNGAFMGAVLDPQEDWILKILYEKESAKKVTAKGLAAKIVKALFKWPRLEIAAATDAMEDYSDLDQFIRSIKSWDAATVHQVLDSVVDMNSYLDWLAVNTLVQSNDTFHKNYYLHNRVEDDKWEIMPWDYDLTFGRNWNDYCDGLCDDLSEGTSIKGSVQMTNRLSRLVLSNPVYYDRLKAKLATLLETEFTEAKMFALIDRFYAQITDLAHQDTRKWPTNEQFDQERDRLKDWVKRRRTFLYRELGVNPTVPQPDTIVTAVYFDRANLIAGDQIYFEAVVSNVGRAATGTTVGVAFLVDGQYITFGTANSLAAGASCTIRSVSAWQGVAGNHKLTAVVDDVNRYPEASETNNAREITFAVLPQQPSGLSDVVLKDIAFERGTDGKIRLAALVANTGTAVTADVVGVAFFVDGVYTNFGVIDPLKPGESQAVRAYNTLALTGTHQIMAIADDVNRFPEQRDDNNAMSKSMDFGGTTPVGLADTIIMNVRLGQGSFSDGDEIAFEASVKNIGTAVTRDLVGVAFLIDGRYITFGTTAPLQPNETQAIRSVSKWRATAGKHRLTAVVDDINRFPEQSESNNQFNLDFEVTDRTEPNLPDSVLDSVDYETTTNGEIIFKATISNLGNVATPDLVGVAFFVDGKYTTFGTIPPMAAGATAVVKAVKSVALTGAHSLTAIVDDVNRYNEISHQNNSLTRQIMIGMKERRAIWINRYDWTDFNTPADPKRIDQMVDNIAHAGFNTIFFQVRAIGDAYYTPGLEPWSARLTGSLSVTLGNNPGWDPLARMLEKAHAAGLEVHAYMNTYTTWLPPIDERYGELWPPATQPAHMFDKLTYNATNAQHPGQYGLGWTWRHYTSGDAPMQLDWGKYLWASPGVDQVQEHILAVAVDLTTRYAIDGLHLDHIRYAGPEYSFDPPSNQMAGLDKSAERDNWQRGRVTDLVSRIYQRTKAIRPQMLVSAAVWPCYQDNWNWNIRSGYDDYYQDSKGWLAAGIIDAIAPMMYDGKADDFECWKTLLLDFVKDSAGRHVYPGIGSFYDDFNDIARRIEAARQAGAPGHALFSYGALNERKYWNAFAAGPYAVPATPPKMS